MRLKLDENIDARLAVVLRRAGHEVSTVLEQGLHGTEDPDLFKHCNKIAPDPIFHSTCKSRVYRRRK